MRLIIADDEELVRYSIRSMLTEMGIAQLSIVEVSNGDELIESINSHFGIKITYAYVI